MSAVGLPLDGHIAEHFGPDGLCQCPCDECTLRLICECVCLDCPCDRDDPAAPRHGGTELDPAIKAEFLGPFRRPA